MTPARRGLVAWAGAGLLVPPSWLGAQTTRVRRLGLLGTYGPAAAGAAPLWQALLGELSAKGWDDGRNLLIVGRYNEGQPSRDAALAAELVAANPDLIVATNSGTLDAARKATQSIPLVMVNVSHAVEAGFVTSLARPGGNVTGVVNQAADMQGKFIELLREVRPELEHLGVCWSPGNQGSSLAFKDAAEAGTRAGVRIVSLPIERPDDVEAALATARRAGVQGLQVHPTPAIVSARSRMAAWALEQKAPTLGQASWVREGFLMSYWADTVALFRTAAAFVDRILRGARPAELPVEQPTRFELTINLRTARAIGVKVPQSLLLRADEVIQ